MGHIVVNSSMYVCIYIYVCVCMYVYELQILVRSGKCIFRPKYKSKNQALWRQLWLEKVVYAETRPVCMYLCVCVCMNVCMYVPVHGA